MKNLKVKILIALMAASLAVTPVPAFAATPDPDGAEKVEACDGAGDRAQREAEEEGQKEAKEAAQKIAQEQAEKEAGEKDREKTEADGKTGEQEDQRDGAGDQDAKPVNAGSSQGIEDKNSAGQNAADGDKSENDASQKDRASLKHKDGQKEDGAKKAETSSKDRGAEKTGSEKAKKGTGAVSEKEVGINLPGLSVSALDNSTKLPDGEYTDFDWTFTGGTGKASLTLTKITVSGGKATGHFTASSDNMTHVYYLGHTTTNDENNSYYNPDTKKLGTGVVAIASKSVAFPVALNADTPMAVRTTAMTAPHWVHYNYTITIDDSEPEKTTDLTVDNGMTGLGLSGAVLGVMEYSGKMTLKLSVSDKDFTKVYAGTAAKAAANAKAASDLTADKSFFIPVSKANTEQDVAFYSGKDKLWHEGTILVDDAGATVTITEGEKADYTAVTAAKSKVPADLSGYATSRVTTLNKALKAVQEGLYASQQAVVNDYADQIEKAIAALGKSRLTIKLQAVDEKTGKAITGASFVVKNASGKTVKADKAGVYSLADGTYSITASAKNYEETVLKKYTPSLEETLTLKLEAAELIPEGTTVFKENSKNPAKTNLFNTTGMFKVVRGVLVAKGKKQTLTVTLSGQGYHYLFKGTYEQAVKNGLKKKNWIKGKKNADGKWEFVIPLEKGQTLIPIVSISQTHLEQVEAGKEKLTDAIFARQLKIDPDKMTLTAGDYDATIDVRVISKTADFQVKSKGRMRVIGGPNSNNYANKPTITMKDARFSKAFIGTAKKAAGKGAKTIAIRNGKFKFSFENTFGAGGQVKTFEDKKPIAVAFYDAGKKKWIDYKLTIDKEKATVTIAALKADEAPPEAPEQKEDAQTYADAANVGTSSVDNGTTLADGSYSPAGFRFSGGTGKVVISCSKVEVRNGQAYATLKFSKPGGGAASVDSLRASGGTYSGSNVFTVPVQLNANNTVVARTTAMSQPHWVNYTIYIVMAEPGKETAEANVSQPSKELDTEAPAIIGLTAKGQIETPYSDLVSIFAYEDGYYLIEVDAVKETARALESDQKQEEEGQKAETGKDVKTTDDVTGSDQAESQLAGDEEGEGAAAESISAQIADLYSNDILKYLVAPADAEIPAGLDKEVLIIRQPADRTLVSSAHALDLLDDLQASENITALALAEEEMAGKSILDDLQTDRNKDGRIAQGGSYDKWDLKTMILGKTNLVVESSKILPRDEASVEADMDAMVQLGLRAAQMNLAMFIDRSGEEENALAQAEWYKVYGIIYDRQDQAQRLYDQVDQAASKEQKEAARKRIE